MSLNKKLISAIKSKENGKVSDLLQNMDVEALNKVPQCDQYEINLFSDPHPNSGPNNKDYHEAQSTTDRDEQLPKSFNGGEDEPEQMKSSHKCDICNFTTSKRYLLSRHIKSHFTDFNSPYECDLCDKAFKSQVSLKNHIQRHTTRLRPHGCSLCSSSFLAASELRRHVKHKHTHGKIFQCTECDYKSVEKAKLKRHMSCHTGEKPYQCEHCSMAFPYNFNLKRHIRTHTLEKPYECEVCSATFSQLNTLKGHRQLHTDDRKVFPCDVCPSTFGRKGDLNKHYEHLHTSDAPVHCEKCGKVFKDRYSLKLHKKEHKVFSCCLCIFSCTSRKQFKAHCNTHRGLRPFKCDLCEECFAKKQILKNHQILAHTEFKPVKKPERKGARIECIHCDKTFRSERFLQKHLRRVEMATESNEELKRETAMKLDKVIDEMLGRDKNMNIQDGNPVQNSCDMTSKELSNSEMIIQEVKNSDADNQKPLDDTRGEGINNGIMEFSFDTDDDSSVEFTGEMEEPIDTANKNKEKKKLDIESCFGFLDYL